MRRVLGRGKSSHKRVAERRSHEDEDMIANASSSTNVNDLAQSSEREGEHEEKHGDDEEGDADISQQEKEHHADDDSETEHQEREEDTHPKEEKELANREENKNSDRKHEENEEETPRCRICFEAGTITSNNTNEEKNDDTPTILISPCGCKGTQHYIHLSCFTNLLQHISNDGHPSTSMVHFADDDNYQNEEDNDDDDDDDDEYRRRRAAANTAPTCTVCQQHYSIPSTITTSLTEERRRRRVYNVKPGSLLLSSPSFLQRRPNSIFYKSVVLITFVNLNSIKGVLISKRIEIPPQQQQQHSVDDDDDDDDEIRNNENSEEEATSGGDNEEERNESSSSSDNHNHHHRWLSPIRAWNRRRRRLNNNTPYHPNSRSDDFTLFANVGFTGTAGGGSAATEGGIQIQPSSNVKLFHGGPVCGGRFGTVRYILLKIIGDDLEQQGMQQQQQQQEGEENNDDEYRVLIGDTESEEPQQHEEENKDGNENIAAMSSNEVVSAHSQSTASTNQKLYAHSSWENLTAAQVLPHTLPPPPPTTTTITTTENSSESNGNNNNESCQMTLVFEGYTAWSRNQLRREMGEGNWCFVEQCTMNDLILATSSSSMMMGLNVENEEGPEGIWDSIMSEGIEGDARRDGREEITVNENGGGALRSRILWPGRRDEENDD